MNNIIEITRQLGAAIQADETYKKFLEAKAACDNDSSLQEAIGKFNLERMNLDNELAKDEKDNDKITELNESLRQTYGQVMGSPSMVSYNQAKTDLDEIVNHVNSIIELCLNGEDPATCEPQAHCSGGSCSSCSGCH